MEPRKLMLARKNAAPLIKKFEGFKANAYRDPVGVLTIGYGHTGSAAYEGNIISPGQAETLLQMDMKEAQKPLLPFVDDLNIYQLAALTSFIYNLGAGSFQRSTLRKKLLEGDYSAAANEFKRWNKAGGNVLRGLTLRRQAEKELFLTDPLKKKQ